MFIPVHEADDIDGNPEKQRYRHGGESVRAYDADKYFHHFDKQRYDEIPFTLLGNQKFARDIRYNIHQIQYRNQFRVYRKFIGIFRENETEHDGKYENGYIPDFFVRREIVP